MSSPCARNRRRSTSRRSWPRCRQRALGAPEHAGGLRDPIAAFYERHPYPPPVVDLGPRARSIADETAVRVSHHLVWPGRPVESVGSVLVAGCGTSQAVRHAMRRPWARVVGIDVSAAGLEHTRALALRHGVDNLELHRLAIEDVGELRRRFDHVVCTGVLHHLADPVAGLRGLREVLARDGAITLMVYARHGRVGVSMLRDYCRRLGITTSDDDLGELLATLRELPLGHPFGRLLRDARDPADRDSLADALCNPRERDYDVAELLELLTDAGLRFGRWERQAPYLPDCGALARTPHGGRLASLPAADQHAAVELFRGTIVRHTVIAGRDDDAPAGRLDFDRHDVGRWVPITVPTAIAVDERLPPGATAALLNRAHTDTDLVMFVDRAERELFTAIDGRRSIAEMGPGAARFVESCWRHDLVVVDTTGTAS